MMEFVISKPTARDLCFTLIGFFTLKDLFLLKTVASLH